MYESFKLLVTSLVLPPGGPIVLVLLGMMLLRGYPKAGRALALVGAVSLWLFSLPIVANALVAALSGAQPLDIQEAGKADAIVILGGGVRPQAPEYGGDTLGRLTLERVRYGAFLARLTKLPVLVTGGAPEPGVRPEAELMRDALAGEYGVAVQWVDSRARNTRQNAINAASILRADGKRRIVLVMHGFDVRRATQRFESAGLKVIPAPTHVPRWDDLQLSDFMPDVAALYSSHFALYELLALARETVVDALA